MDAQRFLAEFGHIANAPNGVMRLRELVLVLAMQGRLLPQLPKEQAIELFETVEREKQESVNSGLMRRPKPLPALMKREEPHAIPDNWLWVRFGDIATHNSGKTLDSVRNSGLLRDYITTSNLYWGRFDLTNVRTMPIREEELEKCSARKDDLLICEGGEAGRAAVWTADYEVCFQNHVHRARFFGLINPFFAYRFFEKLNATGEVNAHRKGIGISNLSSKALAMIPFPLPPLKEQTRIVAKVDELMALCDTLEAQLQDRRKLQNTLRQSTLQAVAKAQSPHELEASWTRLEANFGRLFSAPQDVKLVCDVVFDLALRGALVPDGRLVSTAGQASDELPLLPKEWKWETLETMSEYITSGSRGWKSYMTSRGDAFIRSQDIKQDALVFDNPAYVTLPYRTEGKRTLVRQGDLLLTITGGNVGKCAVVPAMDGNAYVSQHVALIRLNEPWFSEYVHFWMINAFGGRGFLARYIYGDKPGLNLAQVGSVPIPVPPRAQVENILKGLLGYRASFDLLETQLKAKHELASSLAQAAVSSLTGITIEREEEEPVKVPQTELISRLRLGQAPSVKEQAPLASILARHKGELATQDLWQRSTLEIDAFYAQLKTEVAKGWIEEPQVAEVLEKNEKTDKAEA